MPAPVGSERPSYSRDAAARALWPQLCSDSAAGLPAHTRPRPGAAVLERALQLVCGQGSRAASSRPFHLWLPEFTGLISLTCGVPGARGTPGAVLSRCAAPPRLVEDQWLREGRTREPEAGPVSPCTVWDATASALGTSSWACRCGRGPADGCEPRGCEPCGGHLSRSGSSAPFPSSCHCCMDGGRELQGEETGA